MDRKREENIKKFVKEGMKKNYTLEKKLDKIANFFKLTLIIMIGGFLIHLLFTIFFSLDNLKELKKENNFKKAIFNISFKDIDDYKNSKKFIKNFDTIFYNKTQSFKFNYPKYFIPIYQNLSPGEKIFYTLKPKTKREELFNIPFYVMKHLKDKTAYRRDDSFNPKFSELYSGKVVFENFFQFPYIDFINLIMGIFISDPLYKFKYTQSINQLIKPLLKQKKGFFITSYNNVDKTNHNPLLSSFSIYYKDKDIFKSLNAGDYFLANELIANGKKFDFKLKNGNFEFKIYYKGEKFQAEIYKNGSFLEKISKNSYKKFLEKGFYRVVIYKIENYFFQKIKLFWIYLNFQI